MTDTYQRLFAWLDDGGAVLKKKESRCHMIIDSRKKKGNQVLDALPNQS